MRMLSTFARNNIHTNYYDAAGVHGLKHNVRMVLLFYPMAI